MRAGDLLGVEEAGNDGDGEVDVLDGEAREGARAVEVGARLVQVHAVAGQLRGLVPGGVGGLGRVREVGLGAVPGGGGHGGGWPDADEVILGDLDGVEGCLDLGGGRARGGVREKRSNEEKEKEETAQIDAEGTFGPGSRHEPGPKTLWSRLVTPTGTKGPPGPRKNAREAQRAFGPGWCYQPRPKAFFFLFLFSFFVSISVF